jgi:hypothetical protein
MRRFQLRLRAARRWALLLALPSVWLTGCSAQLHSAASIATAPSAALAQTPTSTSSATPAPCNQATQWNPPAGNIGLDDLSMDAPGDGWAVGALIGAFGSSPEPAGVIFHYTHGQWQRLPQTYPGAELATISMDSPDDGWAASTYGMTASPTRDLVLHYTGGQWRQVDIPALDQALIGPPGTLSGAAIQWMSVRMFGPDVGWIFAWTNSQRNPQNPASRAAVVILRYEGGMWTPIPAPAVNDTTEMFWLSAVSANEAWLGATDYGSNGQTTLFAHYMNGAWSIWPQTFVGVTEHISMVSPTSGWAFDGDASGDVGLLHFNGSSWAPVTAPFDAAHERLTVVKDVYTAPDGATWFTAYSHHAMALEQYANGRWSQLDWPYAEMAPTVLGADGSGSLWGIGDISHTRGCAPLLVTATPQGAFLHVVHGRWTRELLP